MIDFHIKFSQGSGSVMHVAVPCGPDLSNLKPIIAWLVLMVLGFQITSTRLSVWQSGNGVHDEDFTDLPTGYVRFANSLVLFSPDPDKMSCASQENIVLSCSLHVGHVALVHCSG